MAAFPVECDPPQEYLAAKTASLKSVDNGRKETPMIYIFNRNNTVQIAWDAKAPKHRVATRTEELDTRVSVLGLIRTFSAG